MHPENTDSGSGQSPVFLILILALGLAVITALAPDFEIPHSSPIGTLSQQAQQWSAVDYYSENTGGYRASAAHWTELAFN